MFILSCKKFIEICHRYTSIINESSQDNNLLVLRRPHSGFFSNIYAAWERTESRPPRAALLSFLFPVILIPFFTPLKNRSCICIDLEIIFHHLVNNLAFVLVAAIIVIQLDPDIPVRRPFYPRQRDADRLIDTDCNTGVRRAAVLPGI